MKDSPTGIVLKILLISHAIYFVKLGMRTSGILLLASFVLFLLPRFSVKVDKAIEKAVSFLGKKIFQIMLSISYFLIFIPLSLFKKKPKSSQSTFIKINSSEIDFERPW